MRFSCQSAFVFLLTTLLPLSVAAFAQASGAPSDRVAVELNTSEAEAVLAILDKKAAQRTVTDADWEKLFATEPYIRLKKREAAMHRDFTDEDFRRFVVSEELQKRTPELRRTLEEWEKADVAAAARRVLPYLPAEARIQPKVYPVIKPKTNSFVFEAGSNPAIFLYLDPNVTREQFENTVAHEMHHIGFASIESETDARLSGLPPATKTAVEWMGAFGEGFAMLAAAGGPDLDPHAASNAKDRERWNHDMGNFASDLHTLDQFFLAILHGKFKSKEEIDQKAYTFFGTQGPWYTVGYKMAVTIENQFGRARLIECMADVRELLPTYNQAAAEKSRKDGENFALWSPELVAALSGK